MNRSSPGPSKSKGSLSLAKAIDSFLKFKTAEGLSQRTITSYEFTLGHWLNYIGDQEVSEIQSSDLTGYIILLRNPENCDVGTEAPNRYPTNPSEMFGEHSE